MADAGGAPAVGTRTGLILLLFLAGLLAAMQFAKVSLTLEATARLYPGAPVPLLVSAVSVMGLVFGAMAGAVVARIGARRAILWAVALSAAASLAEAALPPFAAMMALRLAEGAGHLGLVVALPTMMAAASSDAARPVVMGLWGTFYGVGFALLSLALPWLLGVGGVAAVHAAHGAVLALLWPAMWLALPRLEQRSAAIPGFRAVHAAIYGRASLVAPALGHGLYASVFIAVVAFLPAALGALWLTPLLPLANLAGTFASGLMARRADPGAIVVWGFAASAGLFAALPLAGPLAPACALLAMLATGFVVGAGFAAVPHYNPATADRSRANGAMAQLGNVGTFSGTPLFAFAVLALPGAGVGLLAAAICAIGALAARIAYARAARNPGRP